MWNKYVEYWCVSSNYSHIQVHVSTLLNGRYVNIKYYMMPWKFIYASYLLKQFAVELYLRRSSSISRFSSTKIIQKFLWHLVNITKVLKVKFLMNKVQFYRMYLIYSSNLQKVSKFQHLWSSMLQTFPNLSTLLNLSRNVVFLPDFLSFNFSISASLRSYEKTISY